MYCVNFSLRNGKVTSLSFAFHGVSVRSKIILLLFFFWQSQTTYLFVYYRDFVFICSLQFLICNIFAEFYCLMCRFGACSRKSCFLRSNG